MELVDFGVGDASVFQPGRMYQFKLPDIDNNRLSQFILDLEKKEPSVTRTNRGGWHSRVRLFQINEPVIHELQGSVRKRTERLLRKPPVILSSWANVNRKGHYNVSHSHAGCSWASCYYVATDGTAAAAGEFVALPGKEALKIAPEPGTLLVFPAWMKHEVLKYQGVTPRISVAFNIK